MYRTLGNVSLLTMFDPRKTALQNGRDSALQHRLEVQTASHRETKGHLEQSRHIWLREECRNPSLNPNAFQSGEFVQFRCPLLNLSALLRVAQETPLANCPQV